MKLVGGMGGCHNNINSLTWWGEFPILFKLQRDGTKDGVLKLSERQRLTGDDRFNLA